MIFVKIVTILCGLAMILLLVQTTKSYKEAKRKVAINNLRYYYRQMKLPDSLMIEYKQ